MSLTTKATDTFNRANGSADGSTLDNGNGGTESDTWTAHTGTWTISGNQLQIIQSGDACITVDSTASVDEQQVSITCATGVCPLSRATGASKTGYFSYTDGNIYRWDGAGSYTSIASGATVSSGDVLTIHSVGSSHTMLVNGSFGCSGTDSTYATGKPGVFSNANAAVDDFKYEVASGGGGGAKPLPPFSMGVL